MFNQEVSLWTMMYVLQRTVWVITLLFLGFSSKWVWLSEYLFFAPSDFFLVTLQCFQISAITLLSIMLLLLIGMMENTIKMELKVAIDLQCCQMMYVSIVNPLNVSLCVLWQQKPRQTSKKWGVGGFGLYWGKRSILPSCHPSHTPALFLGQARSGALVSPTDGPLTKGPLGPPSRSPPHPINSQ